MHFKKKVEPLQAERIVYKAPHTQEKTATRQPWLQRAATIVRGGRVGRGRIWCCAPSFVALGQGPRRSQLILWVRRVCVVGYRAAGRPHTLQGQNSPSRSHGAPAEASRLIWAEGREIHGPGGEDGAPVAMHILRRGAGRWMAGWGARTILHVLQNENSILLSLHLNF